MDSAINPDFYKDENPRAALEATRETIAHSQAIDPKRELVEPIITPRFAPSCSSAALHGLGALAKEEDLPIQTHISENRDEIALVRELFPNCRHYADVYASHGLLTDRTVLAHAIHLSREEREVIKQHGAGVSHCPVSNSYLSSGLCPVRELLDMGINVGLGTDVSGGWSPSILTAAREALGVSRVLASVKLAEALQPVKKEMVVGYNVMGEVKDMVDIELDEEEKEKKTQAVERLKLSVEEVLYLATMGGARCLGLEHKIGTFEVGKEWDAQMIICGNFSMDGDGRGEGPSGNGKEEEDEPVELWGKESWSERLAKWVFCGDDRNVRGVWVRGRKVHERHRAFSF